MTKLEPPIQQYLSGKLPTHCSTRTLETNFQGLPQGFLLGLLSSQGFLDNNKPTAQALQVGLVDVCEKSVIWNLRQVEDLMRSGGLKPKRAWANQNLPDIGANPSFGSLTTISTYFNVSEVQVGKWLDEIGLRVNKEATKESLKNGLAQVITMPGKKNKGKTYTQWEVPRTVKILHDAGHPLDFDYQKSLVGKGKNSNIQVSGIDQRVNDFLREFIPLFNSRSMDAKSLVFKTPTAIKKRAEDKINKPGFLTKNLYLKHLE